jgi:Flp pilus assembly protein TadG
MQLPSAKRWLVRYAKAVLTVVGSSDGSQIVEFAVTVPLLAIFSVGIFDFSGAFNLKQKIASAAQEGATTAASQPTYDLDPTTNPVSVQAVETAVFNYLTMERVITFANQGTCSASSAAVTLPASNLIWQYTITGCTGIAGDQLVITVDRGYVFATQANAEKVISSHVTVSYPYHWQFNNVIQLLGPNASFAPTTQVKADAVLPNQL